APAPARPRPSAAQPPGFADRPGDRPGRALQEAHQAGPVHAARRLAFRRTREDRVALEAQPSSEDRTVNLGARLSLESGSRLAPSSRAGSVPTGHPNGGPSFGD